MLWYGIFFKRGLFVVDLLYNVRGVEIAFIGNSSHYIRQLYRSGKDFTLPDSVRNISSTAPSISSIYLVV